MLTGDANREFRSHYRKAPENLKAGYEAAVPMLMMVGQEDDWTPAVHCQNLAQAQEPGRVTFVAYPGAYHGFDGTERVRHRRDVPNGARPGQGVHVGGHPPSRAASRERLQAWLGERWGLRAAPPAPASRAAP